MGILVGRCDLRHSDNCPNPLAFAAVNTNGLFIPMKYNTAIKQEKSQAFSYFMRLANKKYMVEVKRVMPGRTLRQNSYLHLLLGYFGQHFGYTLDEAKTVYKRDVNPSIYVYTKNGAKFLRSSADLDTQEMTKSIDRFREFSNEQGLPLPTATDQEWLRQIDNEIERSKYYL